MFFRKTAKTQSKIMMSYINIYIHLNIRTVYMDLFLFFLIVNRAFTSGTQSLSYSVYHVVHWCTVSLQVGLAPNSGSFSVLCSSLQQFPEFPLVASSRRP